MYPMNPEAYAPQGVKRKFPFGHHQIPIRRGTAPNRQPPQNSDEIVYNAEDGRVIVMPSLSSELRKIPDAIIGLQYVWEYRSPSQSVPPHYACKLCGVNQLQHHMVQHVKGRKHIFKFVTTVCPEKFPYDEEAIEKPNQSIKFALKQIAMELEHTEGRGHPKIIFKEPCEVPEFKDRFSAIPGAALPPPGYDDLMTDYRGEQKYFDDRSYNQTREEYEASVYDYGHPSDYDGYGRPRDYSEERKGPRPMTRPPPRPVQPALSPPQRPAGPPVLGGDCSGALLNYLDTFKIQNEGDAELVLKVTQKLTDVLMEYRLRCEKGPPSSSVYPPPKSTQEPFSRADFPMHPPSRFFK